MQPGLKGEWSSANEATIVRLDEELDDVCTLDEPEDEQREDARAGFEWT